jgi:chemotaxis methyl-accepting protein methylase
MNKKNSIKAFAKSKHINLDGFDTGFLSKTIHKRIAETNSNSENEYLNLLENDSNELTVLHNSLYISYSEFFRNQLTFSVLEKIILPEIILTKKNEHKKEVRIWSSACASGQEVYSVAILLNEILQEEFREINFRIFATDYSQHQLSIAEKGQYSSLELNNVTLKQLNRWFDKIGNEYKVTEKVAENIHFSTFDLLSEEFSSPPTSIFGGFDIIFCANLLFYYKPEFQKIILKKMANSLSKNGYLVVGETERDILVKSNFQEVFPQSGIFKKA